MAAREYDLEIAAIDATLVSIEKVLDLPKLRASAIELEAAAGVPDLWDDPENAQKVTSRLSRVQSTISRLEGLRRRVEDMPILLELANAEEDEGGNGNSSGKEASPRGTTRCFPCVPRVLQQLRIRRAPLVAGTGADGREALRQHWHDERGEAVGSAHLVEDEGEEGRAKGHGYSGYGACER